MIGLLVTGAAFLVFIVTATLGVHRLLESGRPSGIVWAFLGMMAGSLAVTFVGAWASSAF